ncbi:hypothetical protein PV04_07342 [Phialophora macrospora]|uniref:Uncharacterized protein n=1 Tax=Phialophora macrospora TaxID=1851006 RepID=A0A0D2FE13_9EURO|nr:hypothetical protein PV04_07342 [Phialophora macrospora]
MPLSSLRRRTVNEPLPPQQERKTPSPYRGRSTTVADLTSRKSLQSILGSVRKRPSPSKPDILEEEVYLPTDHVQPKAGWKRFRTPSPHPAKGSLAHSSSRLTKSEPPRTFLETLADAIRAPTSMFYKDKRHKSSEDDAPLVSAKVGSRVNTPSPTKSLSSKKSVRFKPGQSVIDVEPRAGPIDIPNSTPALPPMQLATTPLLQCFVRDHREMIPSGRPRSPPVLSSTIKFQQAMAEAQGLIENSIHSIPPLGSPLSEIASPPLAASEPLENPFEDPNEELILVSNEKDEDVSETTSVDTRMATISSSSISEHDRYDLCSDQAGEASFGDVLPDTQRTQPDKATELTSKMPSLGSHDANSEHFHASNTCPRHPSTRYRLIDEKWKGGPTQEDVRERFKQSEQINEPSPEQMNPFSDDHGYQNENICADSTVAPSSGVIDEMKSVQFPDSVLDKQSSTSRETKANCSKTTLEDVAWSPTLFPRNPPWSAGLALGRGRSSSDKHPTDFVPTYLLGRLSSFTEAESDLEVGADPPLDAESQQESTYDLLSGLKPAPPPFPGRAVSSEIQTPPPAIVAPPIAARQPAACSLEFETDEYGLCPSGDEARSITLQLPPGRHHHMMKPSSDPWLDEYGSSPFDVVVDPVPQIDRDSCNSTSDSRGDTEAKDSSESSNYTEPKGNSEKVPVATVVEQLEEAVGTLKRGTPHKTSIFRRTTTRKVSGSRRITPRKVYGSLRTSRKKSISTDTAEATEEDDVMCQGLV